MTAATTPARDLFSVLLAAYRLIPRIAPTERDTPETAAERLRFVADLRWLAKRCSEGLGGTPDEQDRARDDVICAMHGIIAGLDAAMLMREPSPSAGVH